MGGKQSSDDYSQDYSTHSYDSSTHFDYDYQDDHSIKIDNSTHDDHSMVGDGNVNMSGLSDVTGSINIGSTIGPSPPPSSSSYRPAPAPAPRRPRSVMNSMGGTVRIYASDNAIQRGDILYEVSGGKPRFKADVRCISLPAYSNAPIPPGRMTYVSAYLEGSNGECESVIAENYRVPENKSFVFTPNGIIARD